MINKINAKISIILAIFIIAMIPMNRSEASGNYKKGFVIKINNNIVPVDDSYEFPYVNRDDRTMVPVRIISENMGCKVKWVQEEQAAYIEKYGLTVRVDVGRPNAIVSNGKYSKKIPIDENGRGYSNPVVIKNRLFLPLRFISEVFNSEVNYKLNNASHIIEIKTIKDTELNRALLENKHFGDLIDYYENNEKDLKNINEIQNKTSQEYVDGNEILKKLYKNKKVYDIKTDDPSKLKFGKGNKYIFK